jgi:hypothetical protein
VRGAIAVLPFAVPPMLAACIVLSTMESIFQAALFKYAATDQLSTDFPESFLRDAYSSKDDGRPRLPPLSNQGGSGKGGSRYLDGWWYIGR